MFANKHGFAFVSFCVFKIQSPALVRHPYLCCTRAKGCQGTLPTYQWGQNFTLGQEATCLGPGESNLLENRSSKCLSFWVNSGGRIYIFRTCNYHRRGGAYKPVRLFSEYLRLVMWCGFLGYKLPVSASLNRPFQFISGSPWDGLPLELPQ